MSTSSARLRRETSKHQEKHLLNVISLFTSHYVSSCLKTHHAALPKKFRSEPQRPFLGFTSKLKLNTSLHGTLLRSIRIRCKQKAGMLTSTTLGIYSSLKHAIWPTMCTLRHADTTIQRTLAPAGAKHIALVESVGTRCKQNIDMLPSMSLAFVFNSEHAFWSSVHTLGWVDVLLFHSVSDFRHCAFGSKMIYSGVPVAGSRLKNPCKN
jgi:hypothetical protein